MTYESSNSIPAAALDVLEEDGEARSVAITESPFRIGRGGDGKNTLALDDVRISRQSAVITFSEGRFLLAACRTFDVSPLFSTTALFSPKL